MVQVQSTWFPLFDRNPQTWVPNIFQAKASDFRAADPPDLAHAAAPVADRGDGGALGLPPGRHVLDDVELTPCGDVMPQKRPMLGMSWGGHADVAPSSTASRAVSSASVTVKYVAQCG